MRQDWLFNDLLQGIGRRLALLPWPIRADLGLSIRAHDEWKC